MITDKRGCIWGRSRKKGGWEEKKRIDKRQLKSTMMEGKNKKNEQKKERRCIRGTRQELKTPN